MLKWETGKTQKQLMRDIGWNKDVGIKKKHDETAATQKQLKQQNGRKGEVNNENKNDETAATQKPLNKKLVETEKWTTTMQKWWNRWNAETAETRII